MMKKDFFGESIPKIEAILGYSFRDKSLLRQAFTRSSWCNERQDSEGYQSNEVLEFFGDSVLSLSIVSFLLAGHTERYRHGIRTELGEGDFSNIKSKLSDKTNLSVSTKKLGLEKYLLLGEGDIKLGIAEEPSVMEDLFESIVGAVYIDSDKNIDTVMRLVSRILDMSVYTDSRAKDVSPKNALQEWCADKKRRLPQPVYKTLSESGPDHKKSYERGVYIGDELIATAVGKNLKIADALAAEKALDILTARASSSESAAKPTRVEKNEEKSAPKRKGSPKIAPETRGGAKVAQAGKNSESSAPKRKGGAKHEPDKGVSSKGPTPTKADKTAMPSSKRSSSKAAPTRKNGEKPEGVAKAKAKKPEPSGAESAVHKLKKIAAARSVATPEFHDLGMVRTHLGAVEYRIECTFMGFRAVAQASDRQSARERAAEIVAERIPKK